MRITKEELLVLHGMYALATRTERITRHALVSETCLSERRVACAVATMVRRGWAEPHAPARGDAGARRAGPSLRLTFPGLAVAVATATSGEERIHCHLAA